MQLLGTEYGRESLHTDLWVRHLIKRIEQMPHERIVVDDVRFNNEAESILQAFKGWTFSISPLPGKKARRSPPPHASEAGVSDDLIDEWLVNDFTFEGIAEQVREVLIPMVEGGHPR